MKAMDVIEKAARRAAELTTQLLGFARKGRYQSVAVNMNEVLEDVQALLGGTLDKNIDLVQRLADPPPWVQGDPAQMHQVILNLAVNARDSMPDGGVLTFESRIEPWPDNSPGECATVLVRDTGHGIRRRGAARMSSNHSSRRGAGKRERHGAGHRIRHRAKPWRIAGVRDDAERHHVHVPVAPRRPGAGRAGRAPPPR